MLIVLKIFIIFASLFSYENTKSIPLHLQNHTWHTAMAEQHLYLGRQWFMEKICCVYKITSIYFRFA